MSQSDGVDLLNRARLLLCEEVVGHIGLQIGVNGQAHAQLGVGEEAAHGAKRTRKGALRLGCFAPLHLCSLSCAVKRFLLNYLELLQKT